MCEEICTYYSWLSLILTHNSLPNPAVFPTISSFYREFKPVSLRYFGEPVREDKAENKKSKTKDLSRIARNTIL